MRYFLCFILIFCFSFFICANESTEQKTEKDLIEKAGDFAKETKEKISTTLAATRERREKAT